MDERRGAKTVLLVIAQEFANRDGSTTRIGFKGLVNREELAQTTTCR